MASWRCCRCWWIWRVSRLLPPLLLPPRQHSTPSGPLPLPSSSCAGSGGSCKPCSWGLGSWSTAGMGWIWICAMALLAPAMLPVRTLLEAEERPRRRTLRLAGAWHRAAPRPARWQPAPTSPGVLVPGAAPTTGPANCTAPAASPGPLAAPHPSASAATAAAGVSCTGAGSAAGAAIWTSSTASVMVPSCWASAGRSRRGTAGSCWVAWG